MRSDYPTLADKLNLDDVRAAIEAARRNELSLTVPTDRGLLSFTPHPAPGKPIDIHHADGTPDGYDTILVRIERGTLHEKGHGVTHYTGRIELAYQPSDTAPDADAMAVRSDTIDRLFDAYAHALETNGVLYIRREHAIAAGGSPPLPDAPVKLGGGYIHLPFARGRSSDPNQATGMTAYRTVILEGLERADIWVESKRA